MTPIRCLPIFPLPCPPSKWFYNFEGGLSHWHLTIYSAVLFIFSPLFSPNALTWSFSLITLFFMLYLLSCKSLCKFWGYIDPICQPSLLPSHHKNENFRLFGNILSSLSKISAIKEFASRNSSLLSASTALPLVSSSLMRRSMITYC